MSDTPMLEILKLAYGLTLTVDSSFTQCYLWISCKVWQLE